MSSSRYGADAMCHKTKMSVLVRVEQGTIKKALELADRKSSKMTDAFPTLPSSSL